MKRKKPNGEVMRATSFRCSIEQNAKFRRLGGGAWIRRQLDKTPMPKDEKK